MVWLPCNLPTTPEFPRIIDSAFVVVCSGLYAGYWIFACWSLKSAQQAAGQVTLQFRLTDNSLGGSERRRWLYGSGQSRRPTLPNPYACRNTLNSGSPDSMAANDLAVIACLQQTARLDFSVTFS